jgi:uncharacterized protein YceH (UPF0502 family)
LNLGRREEAILCELLLRGPQTPGELRGRTERLHKMDEIADVQSTLQRMMERDPALVCVLPRQPGTKEVRYAHLLGGEPTMTDVPPPASYQPQSKREIELETRVLALEEQMSALNTKVEDLLRQLG